MRLIVDNESIEITDLEVEKDSNIGSEDCHAEYSGSFEFKCSNQLLVCQECFTATVTLAELEQKLFDYDAECVNCGAEL